MLFDYILILLLFSTTTIFAAGTDQLGGRIANHAACKEDVARLCSDRVLPNDLAVLDCMQNSRSDVAISKDCHSYLWQFKLNLTKGDQFLEVAEKMCADEFNKLDECIKQTAVGHKLSCLLENTDSITSGQCKSFLVKLGSIVFSDYRLIDRFTEACKDDIVKLSCGRLDAAEEDHKQGSTIECLSEHVADLSKECHLETLRVAELQADDYHLDRALFLACRDDRERFCRNVQAGQGRVYKCLTKNKMQPVMSTRCRDQLVRRQKLISVDYKVSKGLVKSCKEEIVKHQCFKESIAVKDRKVKLAQVLLCLEGAMHRNDIISGECQAEMLDHRRELLEDYRLTPEVVLMCQDDIKANCRSKEIGGKTLHCLMNQARKHDGVSAPCLRAVEDLLRATDAASDWQVDSQLRESCAIVVETACKISNEADQKSVMSCLMEKLYSDVMTPGCQSSLLEIQYFVARDFRLDRQLYAECRADAVRLCHAPKNWTENIIGPEMSPLILPCLYRFAYHPNPDPVKAKEESLRPKCVDQIRRVMRERSHSVNLLPEIEEACVQDLAALCIDKTGRGEEMQCLQDNLEKLGPDCKERVSSYTEDEAEHIELNPFITAYCSGFLDKHCQDEQDDGNEGQVMDCLIEHKMSGEAAMNSKCRAAVEHFQLIALQDYHFSAHFKRACKEDISKLCPDRRTKAQVVACLSETMRNDTLMSSPRIGSAGPVHHRVSQPCRHQLRSQLQQQHEDIQMNPMVRKPCEEEEKRFCQGIKPGQGRILECLKSHRRQLGPACHAALFQAEREEMEDNSIDVHLMQICRQPIKSLCAGNEANALECLKAHLDDADVDRHCRKLILGRMAEQNLDIRFNPVLRAACSLDIRKYCSDIWRDAPKDHELEGQVVACLKEKYALKKPLSNSCAAHLQGIIEQQALYYQLDPVLVKVCGYDIRSQCGVKADLDSQTTENSSEEGGILDHGQVEECLKTKFNSLSSSDCKRHIALLISAVQVDIHTDPLLHRACAIDLVNFCREVPPGEGRRLNCLLKMKDQSNVKMEPECYKILNERTLLFASASKTLRMDSVNDLVEQLTVSPARNVFLGIGLTFIGVVLLIGIICGRVTKRHRVMKNR